MPSPPLVDFCSALCRSRFKRRHAFSLVELLAVIGIIALLATFMIPAVNSLSSANQLGSGARLIGNMMNVARSEAINQRTRVQLRIATNLWQQGAAPDPSGRYRRLSLWKLDPESTAADPYVPISKWETLPEGIVIDPTAAPAPSYANTSQDSATYFLDPSAGLNNTMSGFVSGSISAEIAWIEFKPTGAVNAPPTVSEMYILLVPGYLSGSGITHTDAALSNWAQIRVSTLTGRIRVLRPQ